MLIFKISQKKKKCKIIIQTATRIDIKIKQCNLKKTILQKVMSFNNLKLLVFFMIFLIIALEKELNQVTYESIKPIRRKSKEYDNHENNNNILY